MGGPWGWGPRVRSRGPHLRRRPQRADTRSARRSRAAPGPRHLLCDGARRGPLAGASAGPASGGAWGGGAWPLAYPRPSAFPLARVGTGVLASTRARTWPAPLPPALRGTQSLHAAAGPVGPPSGRPLGCGGARLDRGLRERPRCIHAGAHSPWECHPAARRSRRHTRTAGRPARGIADTRPHAGSPRGPSSGKSPSTPPPGRRRSSPPAPTR